MMDIAYPILLAIIGTFFPMLAVFAVMAGVEWLGLFDWWSDKK